MRENGILWNWQLFAGEAEAAAEPTAEEGTEAAAERAFTQADIDRIVQKTIRSERQRADRLVEAARAEAEKLAGMNAEERARHESAQREQALAAREEALVRRELRAEALEALGQRGLPGALAEALDYRDAERVQASLDGVEAAFRKAVQLGVEERLRGVQPPAGKSAPDAEDLTDAQYYAGVMRRTQA